MIDGKLIVVVMPAYNAASTIRRTFDEVMGQGIVDHVIIVDDASHDETARIAQELPLTTLHIHEQNLGYGANQKTCYRLALEKGADVIIMVHPDYQYSPALIPAMASLITNGVHPCVIGSRILGGYALKGGMPMWRYVANRLLTLAQNVLYRSKLSEFHTGYRAFSRELLAGLPLDANSDDFVFDSQVLAEVLWQENTIGEISCPTRYFAEASSISFARSVTYGIGCIATAIEFRLAKWGVIRSKRFAR